MTSVGPDTQLEQVYDLITSQKWLFDFLLNTDPLADLSLLTSPLRTNLTTLANTKTSKTAQKDTHHGLLDSTITATSLAVPAFTLDNVTVGLLLQQRSIQAPWPDLQPPDSLHIARFARFNDPPTLLTVRQADACATLDLTLITTPSPRRTTHTDFHFASNPFTAAAAYPPPKAAMLPRLATLTRAELCRPCPLCRRSATAPGCKCELPAPPRPSSLFDARASTAAALCAPAFAGEFAGSAVLQMFRGGCVSLQANLEVTREVAPDVDAIAVTALLRRAVSVRLADVQCRPAGAAAPAPPWPRAEGLPPSPCASAAASLAARLTSNMSAGPSCYPNECEASSPPARDGGSVSECAVDRKERNRLAAAKSNMKRKRQTHVLRLTVVIMRLQAEMLRERENALRMERAELRLQWNTRAAKVVSGAKAPSEGTASENISLSSQCHAVEAATEGQVGLST